LGIGQQCRDARERLFDVRATGHQGARLDQIHRLLVGRPWKIGVSIDDTSDRMTNRVAPGGASANHAPSGISRRNARPAAGSAGSRS
jgi:hypothetical protein